MNGCFRRKQIVVNPETGETETMEWFERDPTEAELREGALADHEDGWVDRFEAALERLFDTR